MADDQMFSGMRQSALARLAGRDPKILARNAGIRYDAETQIFHFQSLGQAVTLQYPQYTFSPELPGWHALVILHYLDLADGFPLTGNTMPFSRMRSGMIRGGGIDRKCELELSRLPCSDPASLEALCRRFGGEPVSANADAAFRIPFLPRFPVTLYFWLPDEDFPLSGRMLPDSSADHYLTIEDAVTVAEILLQEITAFQEVNALTQERIPPKNHYEAVNAYWENKFLQMDHRELSQRFGLKLDTDALFIPFYDREYRVDRQTGSICDTADPGLPISFNTRMAVFNLFYYSKTGAKPSGRFVPFREVKGASPFAPAFEKSLAEDLAKPFDGKLELLKKACRALGGEPAPYSDAGFILYAFPFMPVMLLFWDGDEEFEAQANLLFDADITDFIHEETVCCIAGGLMERLKELAHI